MTITPVGRARLQAATERVTTCVHELHAQQMAVRKFALDLQAAQEHEMRAQEDLDAAQEELEALVKELAS
jgi:hypothetical protein